ncbi:hypothetical protein J2Y38_000450 [Flavobacterium sp. 2755]|uniref:nSTAND3 domain-containing NTPase n=1 Tax=Flavobacterium sp. 2755 TaxID=2817765 RepID=UPI002861B9E0|nr:restriction endonuclease [Flavobacterium sp. 2755]MDR6760271.1 hypothetical protein [Flavobacterium sp. 2755]
MANYDFQSLLSPIDFEHLVKNLLSVDLKLNLNSFAEGKDEGIDLRYSINEEKTVIVQCKRVKSISTSVIDEEYEKVKKLNPKEYYFVCSNDLSVAKVDYIKDKFKKWMKGKDNYIYTKTRLNDLLDQHSEIHRKNFKLWINSATIFNSIVNQPLYERAKSLIDDIKRNNKFYVRNESLNKAIAILNKNKFIIISGIPGIGKSTLAKLLLWEYLQKGYEVLEIRKVTEGEQFIVEDSTDKQVFYYDDFLGENFLKYDVIEGRSNDLIQFINRIKNSQNKILIMTTREYILSQAKEAYEKLDSPELDLAKHTLDLSSYSKKIKSLILYNHLYYSKISLLYIQKLIESKSYSIIINHKNYSPRIIEQLTIKLSDVPIEKYVDEFIESLDKPLGIWNKAFTSQISEGSKLLLYLLMSVSGPITLKDFKKTIKLALEKNSTGLSCRIIDMQNYLKELENSFIKIQITDEKNHYIDFINPSIKDFMLTSICDDQVIVDFLIENSIYLKQLIYTIRYLAKNQHSDAKVLEKIDLKILSVFDNLHNQTKIISNIEFELPLHDIEKIDGLKFYLHIRTNKTIRNFLFEKFKLINLKRLNYRDERKYLEFYLEFEKELKLDYKEVLNELISNISHFESVENLIFSKAVDEKIFEDVLSNNLQLINNKVNDSVKREIEIIDSKNNLHHFRDVRLANLNLSLYSISIAEFDNFFNDKEIKIIEKEKLKLEQPLPEVEGVEEEYDLNFDEDELFKLELFE